MKKVIAALAAISVLLQNAAATVDASQAELTWEMILENPEIIYEYDRDQDELNTAIRTAESIKANLDEMDLNEKYSETYLQNVYNGIAVAGEMNTMFTNRFSWLQGVARDYINSLEADGTYDFNPNDKFNGMKDIWYCFYFFRYMKTIVENSDATYMGAEFNFFGANEAMADGTEIGDFASYVRSRDQASYTFLEAVVNGNVSFYSTPNQKFDVPHFCAVMTVYLYNAEDSALGTWMGYTETVHDDMAGWGGDFQQLINEAYEETYTANQYSDLRDAVSDMMGETGTLFSLEDFYADADAVNLRNIIEAYRTETGTSNIDMGVILSAYYSSYESHIEDFLDTLWYNRVYYFTASDPILFNISILDYELTTAQREAATLGFIDFCEEAFDYEFNMS